MAFARGRPSLDGSPHDLPDQANTPPLEPPTGMIPTPTFLVGSERSGTTLLRLMLDHHPEIAFFHEFEFAVDLVGNDGRWPAMDDYYDHLSLTRTAQQAHIEVDRQLSYPALVNSFLEQKRQRAGKPIVGATVHRHFERLGHLWPDARYIHLLRDPRDVGNSVIQMGWAGNLWTAVDRWLAAEHSWSTVVATLPERRFVEVRYEDLIAAPEKYLTRICAMMGVGFHPDMFSYADNSNYDMPDPNIAGRWRKVLDDESVRLAEAKLGPLLASRGYEPSDLLPLTVTSKMQRRLATQDRKYRRRHRVQRFGLTLCATDFIARRCGIETLHRLCQRRIDQIAEQHLK